MAIKKQTPQSISLINQEIKNWLRMGDELKDLEDRSDIWYSTLKNRQATYQLLLTFTGLTGTKLDDLIYNKTNTSSYWLPNGDIRKEHP